MGMPTRGTDKAWNGKNMSYRFMVLKRNKVSLVGSMGR